MPLLIDVPLGKQAYTVSILEPAGLQSHLKEIRGKLAVITDTNVARLHGESVLAALPTDTTLIEVPAGEASKSMEMVARVCDQLTDAGLDRSSKVIALGGGVVGDLAGFCAAIYYRGIPYIQIPTTIVSQVDSSVGGKTGVNTRAGKNLLGTFHQPTEVLICTAFLDTLPDREFNEGFAEVIKHGIIRDASLIDAVCPLDRSQLPAIVARNVRIKAAIVAEDEHERSGTRALLNFGHTIGHAIESAAGYGILLHGEAISLGIVAACHLSRQKAGFTDGESARVIKALEYYHLPTRVQANISDDQILDAMRSDKKFQQGGIHFVLTPKLGEAFLSRDVTIDDITATLDYLRHW